jgi:hypothetical protein
VPRRRVRARASNQLLRRLGSQKWEIVWPGRAGWHRQAAEQAAAKCRRTIVLKTQVMQRGAESAPVQAYLSEFLSLSEFLFTCLPPWVTKEKIGTLLLASEMPVPIPG